MPQLLTFASQGDKLNRLICSECWKRYQRDYGRRWLFEEYKTRDGNVAMTVEQFELRVGGGDLVESREFLAIGEGRWKPWQPYTGGPVFCLTCYDLAKGQDYLVFDVQTMQEVGP